MALIRCTECQREVSSQAATCPGCGAPLAAKRSTRGVGCGTVLFAFMAILLVLYVVGSSGGSRSAGEPISLEGQARGACSLFLEKRVHDPSSLQWVDYDEWPITSRGNNTWAVTATYRARNVAGALQLARTTCVVRRSGDEWALVSLQ